jgi:hypothetical protein
MIVGVVQGGPGAPNPQQCTTIFDGNLGAVLLKVKNVGTGVVYLSEDRIALMNGSAGHPLEPNEKWEQDYPASAKLYALSPNAGGGIVSREIIPVAPIAAPATPPITSIWAWLARPISSFVLLLAFASFAHAQQNFSVFPQGNPLAPLHFGHNNIVVDQQLTGGTTYVIGWQEPVNAGYSVILLSGAVPGSNPQMQMWNITDVMKDPSVTSPGNQFLGAVGDNQGFCLNGVSYSVTSAFRASLCPPSVTGFRQLNVVLVSTATISIDVFVTSTPKSFPSASATAPKFASPGGYSCSADLVGAVERFVSCNPTDLGMNAITLPASGTTSLSNVIDTRGVKSLSLWSNCSQGYTINVQPYAEDGSTPLTLYGENTGVTAGNFLWSGMSENATWNGSGTLATALLRLPQRALAFSFTNGGATAGTCTARLFLAY